MVPVCVVQPVSVSNTYSNHYLFLIVKECVSVSVSVFVHVRVCVFVCMCVCICL